MKTRKIFSLILAITMLACVFTIPANAVEKEADEHIEIIIENQDISEETKEKIIDFYTNGGEEAEGVATYGLTCTLFGHKLETTKVTKVTHKARTASPRCLRKIYDYSTCTRCDYEESILVSQSYIVCC